MRHQILRPRMKSHRLRLLWKRRPRLRLAKGLRDLGLPLDEMRMTLSVAHDGTCGDVRAALTDTLGKALKATDRRVRELSRARDQLTQLLDGLGDLQPGEQELPGVAPCECVLLVGHPRRRRSAARSTRS